MQSSSRIELLRSVPLTLTITGISLCAFASGTLTILLENNLRNLSLSAAPQIFGCHLLHWSGEHLFWDVAMFVLLGMMCERGMPRAFYATLITSALAIPLSVAWANPHISVYRGLSGLDTALFSLLVTSVCVQTLIDKDRRRAIVFASLLLGLWGKIAFEFASGQVLFVQQIDFVPLPIAHAVGGLLGSIIAVGNAANSTWQSTGGRVRPRPHRCET